MVGDQPRLVDARLAARFEVVRGILLGTLTFLQGARRLRMRLDALEALVDGARRRVLAAAAVPVEVQDVSTRYVSRMAGAQSS
jgi:hypothetical protein